MRSGMAWLVRVCLDRVERLQWSPDHAVGDGGREDPLPPGMGGIAVNRTKEL
jgi:hypothetical protein